MANPITSPKYPAENGHTDGFTRNRWYVDDVTGKMHPEDELARDYNGRLRYIEDIDEPDADELREGWDYPSEDNPADP